VKLVVNHLTRMQPGYICVAGIDLQSNTHVRPVLAGGRLTTAFLKRHGGPFDIGVVVDLGATRRQGSPPEVEDHLFDATSASMVKELAPDRFWKVLKGVAQTNLAAVFGPDLQAQGRGCAVDVGAGTASLGCLVPHPAPRVEIDRYDKVRMHLTDGTFTAYLSVTDLRLFQQDQKTPRAKSVQDVQRRIDSGVSVIVSIGLARAWQKPGDTARRHWLQVNNIHLEDDPACQAK
jgi:hypothetical protein